MLNGKIVRIKTCNGEEFSLENGDKTPDPKLHFGYFIQAADDNEYYVHLGDLEENEQLLYRLARGKDSNLQVKTFKLDDDVKFKAWDDRNKLKGYSVTH